MSSIATCYAREGNVFGYKDPEYYGPDGHRGQDYKASVGDTIVTYEAGTVRKVQYSKYIGLVVVIEADSDHAFEGWAHTRNVKVAVGQYLPAGSAIAEVAGANDRPGSTWGGGHIHTTRGPSVESIFNGIVWDPRPKINLAKSSGTASVGSGTPITTGDNDMAFQIRIQEKTGLGRTLFIEPGLVSHVVHDDVVKVNNYIGVPGGGATNQVSVDDARRLIEVRGFNWATVNGLLPGQAVIRDTGLVVNAGAARW